MDTLTSLWRDSGRDVSWAKGEGSPTKAITPMSVPGIKSKPSYRALTFDETGHDHYFVAFGSGLKAVTRCLNSCTISAHCIHVYAVTGPESSDTKQQQAGHVHSFFDDSSELLQNLREQLLRCCMGSRFSIVGPEIFLWEVSELLANFGVMNDEIQRELLGSAARRVFCVHCRYIQNSVTSNIAPCPSCHNILSVWDHFSRAHSAYMGVAANAEVSHEIPDQVEVFLWWPRALSKFVLQKLII